MPETRFGRTLGWIEAGDGLISVDGTGGGGGFDALPRTARSGTATATGFGAGFAATFVTPAFFVATGLAAGRMEERATDEERVERAVWAISPRAYHCLRFGVNGERAWPRASRLLRVGDLSDQF